MEFITDNGSGLGNSPLPLESDIEYWDSFSWGDLKAVLVGDPSRDLIGYYDRKRALDLRRLGFEFPEESIPFNDASQFLADFNQARIDHYSGLEVLAYDNTQQDYRRYKLLCRGTPGYQAQQGDFFDALQEYVVLGGVPMIHLRLSPRITEDESPLDSLLSMDGIVNKFLSWLQVQIDYRPQYVWVAEPTERGHKHLHIIFFGMEFLISKEKIDSWWKRQGLGNEAGVWIEKVDNPRKMLGYLVKYLLKTVGGDGPQRWQGLLALTRRRQYGVSNGLRRAVAKNIPILQVQQEAEYKTNLLRLPLPPEELASVLTCIGKNNSKQFLSLGIHSKAMIEALFYPYGGGARPPPPVDGVIPPPDVLKSRLAELYVLAKSFDGPSRGGWYLSASQILLREKVNKAFMPQSSYMEQQFQRFKILLEDGLSVEQIQQQYPDLNYSERPALKFLLDKFLKGAGVGIPQDDLRRPELREVVG